MDVPSLTLWTYSGTQRPHRVGGERGGRAGRVGSGRALAPLCRRLGRPESPCRDVGPSALGPDRLVEPPVQGPD